MRNNVFLNLSASNLALQCHDPSRLVAAGPRILRGCTPLLYGVESGEKNTPLSQY